MRFEIGDKLVYPGQGVSIVESIAVEELAGTKMECYQLRLMATDSKVVVPVSNSVRIGLRALTDAATVAAIMKRLRDNETGRSNDWKDRYRANLDRIKTGALEELVDVVLCLADVAARKTLSFRERKMFDHARQMLAVEVAAVEQVEVTEVERQIDAVLDQHLAPVAAD